MGSAVVYYARDAHTFTVQAFNSCTSRQHVCQCLVVQTPMNNISKKKPSTSMALEDMFSSSIHAQETLQSGVWSCILFRLPAHLVQILNVGTVNYGK